MGRSRGGLESALNGIYARVFAIGVNSDLLFLTEESKFISKMVPSGQYGEIISTTGHDAFLIEFQQLSRLIQKFYKS